MLSDSGILLLKAAFEVEERASRAWESWLRIVDIREHHRPDVYRLLPIVYDNLYSTNPERPHEALLRGVKRKAWYNAGLTIGQGVEAYRQLGDDGIRSVVVHDAALAVASSPHGTRGLADRFDLLIDAGMAARAAAVLESAGWRVVSGPSSNSGLTDHRRVLRSANGRHVTIHSFLPPFGCTADESTLLLESAVETAFDGHRIEVLRPRYELIAMSAPTDRLGLRSLLQRTHDAISILVSSNHSIDGSVLANDARRRCVGYLVSEVLSAVAAVDSRLVPLNLQRAMEELWPRRWEPLESSRRQSSSASLGRYWKLWYDHRRQGEPTRSLMNLIVSFPGFLWVRWGLNNSLKVLGRAVRRVLRRP